MRRIAGLLWLVLVVTPLCGGQSDEALKGALFGQVQRFMTAWQKHDMDSLGALLAPEFLYVSPRGVGTRESVVRDLGAHCNLTSYRLGEPKLLRTGADTAALIYTIHQDLTCFGHPDVPDVINTDTFMRRDGKWLFGMTTTATVAKT